MPVSDLGGRGRFNLRLLNTTATMITMMIMSTASAIPITGPTPKPDGATAAVMIQEMESY